MLLTQKVKIDNSGRIQIPRTLLNAAGLKLGDTLYVSVDEDCKDLVVTTGREKGLECHWITKSD